MATINPSLSKKLFRGVTYLYLMQIVVIPLGIIANIFAGKLLNPADYGTYVSSLFVVSMVLLVSDASLSQALTRSPDELKECDYGSMFVFQAGVGLILGVVLYLAANTIGRFFRNYKEIAEMTRWLSVMPILGSFINVAQVKIERSLQYGRYSVYSIVANIIERSALLIFMTVGLRGFSYAYARLLGMIIQIVLFSMIHPWNPISLVSAVIKHGWTGWKYLRFGLAMLIRNLSGTLVNSVIPGIGGRMFSLTEVGRIAWAQNMATVIGTFLPQMVGRTLVAASSQLYGNREKLRDMVETSLLLCSAVLGVGLAVLSATLSELLNLIFRSGWVAAAHYFSWSCAAILLGIFYTLLDAVIIVLGRGKVMVLIYWSWAIILCGSSYLLAKLVGPVGLLGGFLVGAIFLSSALYFYIQKSCKVRIVRNFIIPGVISIGMWVLTRHFKTLLPPKVAIIIGFDFVCFVIGLAIQVIAHPRLLRVLRTQLSTRR